MKKQDLQNERLDRIGRKLLGAARLPGDEIEKIVAAPRLFDSVKARIEAEELALRAAAAQTSSGGWANFPLWNWRTAAAFAVPAIFLVGVLSVIFFKNFEPPSSVSQTAAVELQPPIAGTGITPPPGTPGDTPQTKETNGSEVEPQKSVRRAGLKNALAQMRKSSRKSNRIKSPLPRVEDEEEDEFQALTFAGNPDQAEDGGKIVRVELSRSSLFALGVNLPVENENDKIKTDLLISSDGVVKGIRLAK